LVSAFIVSLTATNIATFHQEACRSRILGALEGGNPIDQIQISCFKNARLYIFASHEASGEITRHLSSEDFALTVSYSKTCPRPQPAVASFAAQATVRGAFMNQYTVIII